MKYIPVAVVATIVLPLAVACSSSSTEGASESSSPSLPSEVTLAAPSTSEVEPGPELRTPQVQLVQTITLPGQADKGALSPDGSQLFVLDTIAPQIFFIDLVSSEMTTSVSIGRDSPDGRDGDLQITPSGETLFAVVSDNPLLLSLDPQKGEVEGQRELPSIYGPSNLSLSPDGDQLAVTGYGMPTLDIVSTRGKKQGRSLPTLGYATAFSPDGRRLYSVSREGVGLISVFDLESDRKVAEYRVGDSPNPIVISPDGMTGYANSLEGAIIAFNTETGAEIGRYTPEYGGNVADIALSPDGRFLYVSQSSGDLLYALDATTMLALSDTTVSLNGFAGPIVLSEDGSRLFVMTRYDGRVLYFTTGL